MLINPFAALFERRAWTSEVVDYLIRGSQSISGQTVNEKTAFNLAAVWTAVSLITRSIASLPVRVVERIPDGGGKRPDFAHPVNDLLRRPNSWQTREQFIQMEQAHLLLRGNAYAWKNVVTMARGGPRIRELIPLHPDRVKVTQDDKTNAIRYELSRKDGGESIPIGQSEMIHLRGLSTDGVKGRSCLEDARDVLGVSLATQQYSGTFWENDATPSLVVTHPGNITQPAQDRFEKSWMATYGSGTGKRSVAIVEEGMKVEPLGMAPEASQFLETRKFQRSEIGSWFHVPPHLMGDTEKSTSWGTGIEQQNIGFLVYTIRPWLVAWEQRLSLDLLDDPERYSLEFVVDGFLRGDMNSQSVAFGRGIQSGYLSPNDVRALLGMNPIPGGDVYLAPQNMAPLDLLRALTASQIDAGEPDPDPSSTE